MLWLNNKAIEGGNAVLNRLQELGKRLFFVTNNANRSRDIYAELARSRGFNMTKDQIITPILSTVNYLRSLNFNKKVYSIGPRVIDELRELNIRCTDPDTDIIDTHYSNYNLDTLKLDPEVGAVLVNYEYSFHYSHILRAANYLQDANCLFLATCIDDRIPSGSKLIIPGISPIVRSIEACSYRQVMNLGKPNPAICSSILNDGITKPERTLMIGDNAKTDILLGKNCGFQTLLVGSGLHGLNDIERWQNSNDLHDKHFIPDTYLDKLGDLLRFLK